MARVQLRGTNVLISTLRRAGTLLTVFMLSLQSLVVMSPMIASAVAPNSNDVAVPFTSSELATNWAPDRSAPTGGYSSLSSYHGKANVVEMSISASSAPSPAGFYNTEGIKRSLPDSDTIKADLYVDGDWESKDVRVGLWATAEDDSNATSSYPIIEFSTKRGNNSTGWRVWDGVNGGWTNLSTPYAWGNWYNLEIALNDATNQVSFFINNTEVLTLEDADSAHLNEAIINSYNYGTNNYSAHWADMAYGSFDTATAPSNVYVDDDLAGKAFDENGHIVGYDAFASVQDGINGVAAGGNVYVAAGTYVENVNVNKAVTVQGAGAASTSIVGTNANATPLFFSGSNATVDGFTITHNYTPDELAAWNFNNNGVQFGQLTTGNTLSDSVVSLNRNGVYINNAQGNKLIGNTITNNRTGINMTNALNGTQITGNTISDNWTIGLVMYTATPSLTTNLSTLTVSGNTFDQNWYTEVLVKDANFNGPLNLTNNTFTDHPVTYSTSDSASLNEPGFAAQHPVVLGGSAVKPSSESPTLRIYNSLNASLAYSTDDLDIDSDTVVLTNDNVTVTVPQDAVITPANPSSWNGVVSAPRTVTSGVNLPSGTHLGVGIEVGSPDTTLTFSKAVKLVFVGQAGKLVGWQAPGSSTFTPITTDCNAYLPDLDTNMPAGGDCKVSNDGSGNLVVWTKHFTTFATYTVTTSGSGGAGSEGGADTGTSTTTSTTPTTVFAQSFNVTPNNNTKSSNGIKDTDGDVLGTDTKSSAKKNVAAAQLSDDGWTIFGLAWYWWLVILAAIGAVWWLVNAWRNRSSDSI